MTAAHQAQQALQQGEEVAGKGGHGCLQAMPVTQQVPRHARAASPPATGLHAPARKVGKPLATQALERGGVRAASSPQKRGARVPVRKHVWSESRRPTGATGACGYTEG